MAKINELKNSKFLTQHDVDPAVLWTIKSVEQVNMSKEGAPPEYKYCVFFEDVEKPMVLNSTNGQIIAKIVGDEEMDNWPGHQVVVYRDPNVSFGSELKGGIRCRAPKKVAVAAKPTAKPATAKPGAKKATVVAEPEPDEAEVPEDDVPF